MTGAAGEGTVDTLHMAGIVIHAPIVTIPDHLHDLLERTKEETECMTSGMVRVSAVEEVLNKMKVQRWITITGNAGDGKTVLGYLVLKELLQEDVRVFTVYKPKEYDQIAKMKDDKVIMFDDRFGAFLADHKMIKNWFDVIQKVLKVINGQNSKIKVIFISRKNVVNESKEYLGRLTDSIFDKECVIDLSKKKVTVERLEILEYHLGHENVTIDSETKARVCNREVAHGFPHCCKMFSKLRTKGYDVPIEEFFESPLKFLDMTTNVLYNETCRHLFQLMIKNDGKLDVYNIEDEVERQALLKVEKEQEGSYITVWRNGFCHFAHPSVYESVLNVINDTDPLYCVQYATLSVIRQKMIISTSDEEDSSRASCYIIVKPIPAVMKALAERFREEILKGDYSVFEHRLCQSREFCKALVFACVNTKEQKQFINRPGNDRQTMLWTALKSGNMVAVQTLVRKAGADVEIQDERGRTPLQYLCQLKNSPAASASGDDRQHRHHMQTIRVIITEGRGEVNIRDQYGQTPLLCLFKCQTLTCEDIKWIITDAKCDLNKWEHKTTPLHYLCAFSGLQLDTVDLVINEGKGDFNKGDEHGTTPFHFLCENTRVDINVKLHITNTAKGDFNQQDDNGITPLHVLCKGTLPMKDVLTLIKEGDKADMYGNTPLHFLCRRRGISDEEIQQLKQLQLPESNMKKQNKLGYTPLDYLNDQDGSLPLTDGMIDRSAADLVLYRVKHGDTTTIVLGRAMILNSRKVYSGLQVEDFGRELNNMARNGERNSPGQFKRFKGTCSSPLPLPPSPSPLTCPYWETQSTLRWRKNGYTLLEMGVKEGERNMDEGFCVSDLPGGVGVSVFDECPRHPGHLCIKVKRRDQEWWRGHQVGECVSLPRPTSGVEVTFTFGLVLDVGRGRVAFLDVGRGKLLCKLDLVFTQQVFPMFYVNSFNDHCATRMRLVSGREISVTDQKIQLIQQALSD